MGRLHDEAHAPEPIGDDRYVAVAVSMDSAAVGRLTAYFERVGGSVPDKWEYPRGRGPSPSP